MSRYVESFDETNCMSFSTDNDELLENTIKSGKKSVIITKKEFNSKPVHNEKCLKTKAKSFECKTIINFFIVMKYQKKALIIFVYQ